MLILISKKPICKQSIVGFVVLVVQVVNKTGVWHQGPQCRPVSGVQREEGVPSQKATLSLRTLPTGPSLRRHFLLLGAQSDGDTEG